MSSQPPKLPIDVLEERIYKQKKDLKIKPLQKAYQQLKKGGFDSTIKLVSPLKTKGDYQDYAHWLTAEALIQKSQTAFQTKNYPEAKRFAEKVLVETAQIPIKNPYTSLIKSASVLQGTAEAISASSRFQIAANTKFKKRKNKPEPKQLAAPQVVDLYERSLKRLSDYNALGEFTIEHVERFSEACHLAPSDLCYQWIQELSLTFPKASRELKIIAKYFPSAVDLQKSKTPYYGRMTQNYRTTELDVQSFEPAINAYTDGKYKDAIELFTKFLDEFPRSTYRYRGKYWLASALKHRGEKERSHKLFLSLQQEAPLTYYGLIASIESGIEIDSAIDGSLPMASDFDPTLLPEELVQIKRAETFLSSGAKELAAKELSQIKVRSSLSSPFLMYLATLQYEANAFRPSFFVLSELIQRGYDRVFSSFVVRLVFPITYSELIEKYAKEQDLDPLLVLSLIKQESAFDDSAVSFSGALGLMQVMPATAVDTDANVLRAEMTDAETNIRVGVKYLKRLMTRFDGNIILSLAGYNAGPNAADRWFKAAAAPKTATEFIESIPYKETREYVASIIRNYFWYSKKITGEMPKNLDYFWNVYGPQEKTLKTLFPKDYKDREPSSTSNPKKTPIKKKKHRSKR